MKAGDISPLAGMLTGEGLTGELMAKGVGGLAPMMIARQAQRRREGDEERKKGRRGQPIAATRAAGMKAGGKVKKTTNKPRGCGCARKGTRKAKMY